MISRRALLLRSVAGVSLTGPLSLRWLTSVKAQEAVLPHRVRAFDPRRSLSPIMLDMADEIFREDSTQDPTWATFDNPWMQNLSDLDNALRANEQKARNARFGTSFAFAPLESSLELASVNLPAPASYVVWGTEKLISEQKNFILRGIEQRRVETGDALAKAAAERMHDERGLPYLALFPPGSPEVARRNMEAAAQSILNGNSALSGNQKAILLESIVRGMSRLYADGRLRETGNQTSPCDCATLLAESSGTLEQIDDAAKKMASAEDELAVRGARLAEAQVEAETLIQSKRPVPQSLAQQINVYAQDVIEVATVSQDVVAAAVVLGLSPNIGEQVNRVANLAGLAANTALSFTAGGPPLAMISATSQLITGIFGKRKRGPGIGIYLQRIYSALSTISNQLVEVQEMQARILSNVRSVQENQIVLANLTQRTISEVQINRRLIIDLATGPMRLLEREVERYGLNIGQRDGWGPSLGYDAYAEMFAASGDVLIRGLNQIEEIFDNTNQLHMLLSEATYLGRTTLETEVDDDGIRLNISADARQEQQTIYRQRVETIVRENIPHFFLTEAANAMAVFFPDAMKTDEAKLTNEDLSQPLIEVGMLLRLGWLTCSSYFLQEMLIHKNGQRQLMNKEEILTHSFNQPRGYDMLNVVLHWVEVAISQQLILDSGFDRIRYLNAIVAGENPPIETPYPYGRADQIGSLFADMQQSAISLRFGNGSYDPRWVNDVHMIYARGQYAAWFECYGVSQFDCDYRLGGGQPSSNEIARFRQEALEVIGSRLLFPRGQSSSTAEFALTVHHDDFPDSQTDIGTFLRDQFELELIDSHYEMSLSARHWPRTSANFLGPWIRAEQARRTILEQLAFEEHTPHQNVLFSWVDPRDEEEARLFQECENDPYELIMNVDCFAPDSWADWSIEDQERLSERPSTMRFEDFDIHRDPATGHFAPEVEALLDLKAALIRHLTPYRIYQDQDIVLKQRWIDTLRLRA